MLCAVVGAAIRISYHMGELVFYQVVPLSKNFIQQSSGHCPETMRRHLFLRKAH